MSIAIALIAFGACERRPHYPPMTAVELGRGVCDTINNTFRCATFIEQSKLASAGNALEVSSDSVCFQGRGWRGCVPREYGHPDWRGTARYVGTLSRPSVHVLWVQYPEGSDVRLIDAATGVMHVVDDIPEPSPSGERLLVASGDLIAQYGPNRFTIWLWANGAMTKEWSIEPTEWDPRSAEWLDESRIRLARGWPFLPLNAIDTIEVRRDAGGWRLAQ